MDRLLELTYQAEQTHFWFRGFRRFVRPLLASACAGVARPRLLDCGCGTGSNLEMLGRFGDAVGFDLTPRGVAFAREHGRRVARASAEAIPFRDDEFDVVTSFDMLQCVPDEVERAAIAEMARVLRPGGAMVLHVAALELLRGRHSVLSQEFRRYTPARLRALVERAGLSIERLTFDQASLLPIVLPVRLWQRMTARDGEVEAGEFEIAVPPAPVNLALSALVSLEALALGVVDMPCGSSLMCLARKPRR